MTDDLNRALAAALVSVRKAARHSVRSLADAMTDLGHPFTYSQVTQVGTCRREVKFSEAYVWCQACGFDLITVLSSVIDRTPLAPARISMLGTTYVKESA